MALNKKTVDDINVKGRRVLVRCDFNVPLKGGEITDDTRIIESLESINYLIKNNDKIIILSHMGKVKTESDKVCNTLYPVYLILKDNLK